MPFDYADYGTEITVALRQNAVRLDRAAATGLRPPPKMGVDEWAALYRRFPEESAYPGRWRNETAPYLVEIMQVLTADHPAEDVAIKKCAQSGGSASGENMIGYVADIAPGPMMYIQATFKAALDWADEKLWPMIEATPRLDPSKKGLVLPKDGEGSTKLKLKFLRGGSLILAGANSAASLRQHTVRYVIEDDLDQFPDDLEGQGSPEFMIGKRLTVYKRRGLSKRLKISTPTIKGASKIDAAFLAGDRRHFYLKCQSCGDRFDPVWSDIDFKAGPDHAVLVAPCCGAPHEHWQKPVMSLVDGWLATSIEGQDAPPRVLTETDFQARRRAMPVTRRISFWIGGLVTAFQTWADMAANFVGAQGDVNKLRAWTNLDWGDVFELKGGVPDFELLKDLREEGWERRHMPVRAGVATLGVDVQGDGLYGELVGWGPNAETWDLDAFFLPGPTDIPGEGAWSLLEEYVRRPVPYPGGRSFPIDQVCVDGGYHTAGAEAFCRKAGNRLVVFGRAGWTLPVLGRGEFLRYAHDGKRAGQGLKRAEDKAYIVGTFGVKASFHGYLRAGLEAAAEEKRTGLPVEVKRGRCHFGKHTPDQWFEQITAEGVVVKLTNGIPRRVWEPLPGRQNHWLDCRVYNHAAAERLLLDTLSDADWARLRLERGSAPTEPDLFSRPIPSAEPARESAPVPKAPAADSWVQQTESWL